MDALCHIPLNNQIIERILDMRIKECNHVYLKLQLKPCWVKEEDLIDYKDEIKKFKQERKKRYNPNESITNLPPPPSYFEACQDEIDQSENNYQMLDPSIYQHTPPPSEKTKLDTRPIHFIDDNLINTQNLLRQAKMICKELRKRSTNERASNEKQNEEQRKRKVTFNNPCFEISSGEHSVSDTNKRTLKRVSDKSHAKSTLAISDPVFVIEATSISADIFKTAPSSVDENWTWEELQASGYFQLDDGVYDFCTDTDLSNNWKIDMLTKPWMETNMDEFAECVIL